MDAVLVECGFMTNRREAGLLRTETYRKAVAEGIVQALTEQFKLQRKDNAPKVFKVQAGAFERERNAKQLAARLKSAGFDAYIE